MTDFHFLRPWWWLALIPFLLLIWLIRNKKTPMQTWEAVCDHHLLAWLTEAQTSQPDNKPLMTWIYPLLSLFFIIIALTGPTWSKLPAPVYQNSAVQILVLDLSDDMLLTDVKPDRLTRAGFIMKDLLHNNNQAQFGMIAYTGEPFVVSPLTEDPNSIESLLPALKPDIMPVQGQNLASALHEAEQLIKQAGFNQGNILVLTSNPPSKKAISKASTLAEKGIYSSIIPILPDNSPNSLFESFAKAGDGQMLSPTPGSMALKNWPQTTGLPHQFHVNKENSITLWQDEGRWFLIPALLFLLPIFRKGWIQRIAL